MRRRFKGEDRERILNEVRAGASVAVVSRRHGLSPSMLYRWQQGARRDEQPKFAVLAVSAELPKSAISIQVGEAFVRVEGGFDAELLRAVVAALSGHQ